MASRAILRRKRYLFYSLNRTSNLVQRAPSFERGSPSRVPDSWNRSCVVSYSSSNGDPTAKEDSNSLTKDVAPSTLTAGIIWHRFSEASTLSYEIRKPGVLFPLALGWKKEYAHYSSTAAAGQPEFNSDDDKNEEPKIKQKREASPEECDQAVEGLSTVKAKAKAKAKQLQESQKRAESVLRKMWAMLLGIGPAFRTVASMNR